MQIRDPKPETRNPGPRPLGSGPFLQALPFLLPNLLGFLVFTFLPVLACFGLSLTEYQLSPISSFREATEQIHFVGLENFARLAHDTEFWRFLGNTLFLMLGIPLSILGSLLLALLLNQRLRGIKFPRDDGA